MNSTAAISPNVIELDLEAGDREKESYRWWPSVVDARWQSTDVTFFDERTDWLAAAYKKLSELARLRAGWDTYGADAPNQVSIRAVRIVLGALALANCAPTSIDPSAEGGICLSFKHGHRYADIECFNSGEVFAVTSLGGKDTKAWDVGGGDSNLQAAICKIRNFIGH